MKIAQVSPLFESVPPRLYGGTERIVSFLTEQLVRIGHDVTLFASGDSRTSARLVPITPAALRLRDKNDDAMAHHALMIERVFSQSQDFDVIHSHIDFLAFSMARRSRTPVLSTLHGRLDLAPILPLYREFFDLPWVSISDSQREPLADALWQGTVYHGLPLGLFKAYTTVPADAPLVFLGRISVEKGVDRAIYIAHAAGVPLKIAAKADPADRAYYEKVFRPLLTTPGIEYIGEITETKKNDFLGLARGLLFPIDWPEPFGLVMIEAMACGTPVIAYRRGSVPEILEDGVTGYIVNSEKEAAEAIGKLPLLNRALIRQRFEERFSDVRMTQDYVKLYEGLLSARTPADIAAVGI